MRSTARNGPAVFYAVTGAIAMLTGLNGWEYRELLTGAGATFVRVIAALVIGAAWTIPAPHPTTA